MTQTQVIADRYDVHEHLGEGGFAQVYKATDQEMGRLVAVKLLKLELLGNAELRETFLDRFSREVSVTASLEHPHLVPVYDTGVTRNAHDIEQPYLVMKMLEGETLERCLGRQGALSIEMVHHVGMQVLDALSYVHQQGVVHKDLKPANLFMSTDHRGEPHIYVMDFGIAHDRREGERMTQTGAFAGTVQYLAPEYLLDQIAEPGVDVYQMGLILLELLSSTAVVPADMTMPELIARYIRKQTVELPPALDGTRAGEVLRRATLFDRHQRYQDAGEFLRDWEALTPEDFPQGAIEFPEREAGEGRPLSDEIAMGATVNARPVPEELAMADTMKAPAVTPDAFAQTEYDVSSGIHQVKRRRLWLSAAVLLGMIAVCGVVVAALLEDEETPALALAATSSDRETKEANPVVQPDEPSLSEVESPATEPIVTRQLTTMPAGVQVVIDGEDVGTTPLPLVRKSGAMSLELSGYEPMKIELEEGTEPLHFEMRKVEEKRPRRDRKESSPRRREQVEEPAQKELEEERPATTLPPEF